MHPQWSSETALVKVNTDLSHPICSTQHYFIIITTLWAFHNTNFLIFLLATLSSSLIHSLNALVGFPSFLTWNLQYLRLQSSDLLYLQHRYCWLSCLKFSSGFLCHSVKTTVLLVAHKVLYNLVLITSLILSFMTLPSFTAFQLHWSPCFPKLTSCYLRAFALAISPVWNALPLDFQLPHSLSLRSLLKWHFFQWGLSQLFYKL